MQNLFTLAANETTSGSLFYLNAIFGTVGNVLGGTGPAILGSMFTVFNTTVLVLGSLIVTYTTVVSVLMTAHEGEPLGKKFKGLWMPIRTVMGIAALVPTTTGYSFLQISLMWFIIQGVGAADTLWTNTVNYVASGGTTAPQGPGTPIAGPNTATLMIDFQNLFVSLVCQAEAKMNTGSGYYCYQNTVDPFCSYSTTDMLNPLPGGPQVQNDANGNPVYYMGPQLGTMCGQVNMAPTSSDPPAVVQAKQQAFAQVIPTLGNIAAQFVALDDAYGNFLTGPITVPTPPPAFVSQWCNNNGDSGAKCNAASLALEFPRPSTTTGANTVQQLYWTYGLEPVTGANFISLAASVFTGIVGAAMTQSQGAQTGLSNPTVQATAVDNGWIFAGAFFYYIAQANNQVSNSVLIANNLTNVPPAISAALSSSPSPYQASISNMISAATVLMTQVTSANQNTGSGSLISNPSCGSAKYGGGADSMCGTILNEWIGNLSGSQGAGLNGNPIVMAQGLGNDILNDIISAVATIITVAGLVGLAGGVMLGFGPLIGAIIAAAFTVVPIIMFFLMIFFPIGVTFAVYTPMIPYMIFTFGAINWLIATIETMIAAPIVAIGLLHPEGGENIWGKAEAALNLLLNIFLRPSLMIFGMVAAMLMTYAVIMMVNFAFLSVVSMVSPGSNILELIFFMVMYTAIFTAVLNKCFDLIYVIPDRILRWMGGGQEQFGEGSGHEAVGKAVQGAVEPTAGAMKKGVQSAQGVGEAMGKPIGEGAKAITADKTKASESAGSGGIPPAA